MRELFKWSILVPDQKVYIKNKTDSEAVVIDENTVSFNGETMTYNEWAKKVTGWSAMSVYESIIPNGETRTLHEIRLEKMDELEK